MFGKVTLTLEKSTAIAAIGLVIAFCACFMLKTGLEKLILGSSTDAHARTKGGILTTLALAMLTFGIVTILESELVLSLLAQQLKYAFTYLR